MRIDKYLKVARLIKRRSVANEACDQGRITVNGRIVKASYDVKENDIIEIKMGERIIKVQVMAIAELYKPYPVTPERLLCNYRPLREEVQDLHPRHELQQPL